MISVCGNGRVFWLNEPNTLSSRRDGEMSGVMVVMDDEEARGFLFSYDKLFGAKKKTQADLKNEESNKETGIDRTRRFFYVTCSRSEGGLALIAYSSNPEAVYEWAVSEGWFDKSEIKRI